MTTKIHPLRLLPAAALALAAASAPSLSLAAQSAAFAPPRLAEGIAPAPSYQPPKSRYTVANGTPVYRTMDVYGPQTGQALERGQAVDVLAEAQDGLWLLVGRNGTGVGYAPRSRLCPADLCPAGKPG